MASSLESGRNAFLQAAKLDFNFSKADADSQRVAISRSFTSDTVTAPTEEMYTHAARVASLGDDVMSADECTNALEAHVAKLAGKEAGLFVLSGTMSNQLALRVHLTQPPYSVLGDQRSHIWRYETSGASFHSAAQFVPIQPENGRHLTLSDIEAHAILDDDVHLAPTRVVALENTLNGTIFPQSNILEIAAFARQHDIKLHLDGARLWHVAIETGASLEELCQPFESVSLCFSKGLGAPVGSILLGRHAFIKKARHFRKLFGGGARQIGFISACAAYSLSHHLPLLSSVHALTRRLADGLQRVGCVITVPVDTCIVFYDPSPLGVEHAEVAERAAGLESPLSVSGSRLVVHIQTTPEAIDDLVTLINTLAEEKRKLGFVYQPPSGPVKFRDDPYIRQKPQPVQKKRVAVGDVLPDVILKNEKGEDVRVADLAKETGVIIFAVPKADTPGCNKQACHFRDNHSEFKEHGFIVFALSADPGDAQNEWQSKFTLPYSTLSDPNRALIEQLGAMNAEKNSTTRSHFVFEKGTGRLLDAQIGIKPNESHETALAFLRGLAGSQD